MIIRPVVSAGPYQQPARLQSCKRAGLQDKEGTRRKTQKWRNGQLNVWWSRCVSRESGRLSSCRSWRAIIS